MFLDIIGVHIVPWTTVMEKTEIWLKNTKKYLEKKGIRCNRTVQQVKNMQAGDTVGAGDSKNQRLSCLDGKSRLMK
jgi:hypothetical protein